jgi:CHAT domain-containing protein
MHKIYLAPSGQLYRIAFAALPVDSIRLLSDKYQLVQLNSTASVIDQSESYIRHTDKVHLYGGVIYGGGDLEYLQGTEREITGIRKLGRTFGLSTTSYTGLQATEESIEALNALDTPAVLHIATHGFFFPAPDDRAHERNTAPNGPGQLFRQSQNPLFRSGILLAGAGNAWKGQQIAGSEDGILTAYKVSNLYFPKMKLVVLSACETALGEIEGSEGVYGLQRAFKMAGAEYLVISLWKVPDKETGEFMQLFYRRMFEGQSVNDAFYHAQNDMKALHRNSPNSWAAWVLTR